MSPERHAGIHIELTTDSLDALYGELRGQSGSHSYSHRTKSLGNVQNVLVISMATLSNSPNAEKALAEQYGRFPDLARWELLSISEFTAGSISRQ